MIHQRYKEFPLIFEIHGIWRSWTPPPFCSINERAHKDDALHSLHRTVFHWFCYSFTTYERFATYHLREMIRLNRYNILYCEKISWYLLIKWWAFHLYTPLIQLYTFIHIINPPLHVAVITNFYFLPDYYKVNMYT